MCIYMQALDDEAEQPICATLVVNCRRAREEAERKEREEKQRRLDELRSKRKVPGTHHTLCVLRECSRNFARPCRPHQSHRASHCASHVQQGLVCRQQRMQEYVLI